jgi:hypothetical protein
LYTVFLYSTKSYLSFDRLAGLGIGARLAQAFQYALRGFHRVAESAEISDIMRFKS